MSMPSPDPGASEPAAGQLAGRPEPAPQQPLKFPGSSPESVTLDPAAAPSELAAEQPAPDPACWALVALVPYDGQEPEGIPVGWKTRFSRK